MPTYLFYDSREDETIEVSMKISELNDYKENNPHMEQRHSSSSAALISGRSIDSGRLPDAFKDRLRLAKQINPLSKGLDHLI